MNRKETTKSRSKLLVGAAFLLIVPLVALIAIQRVLYGDLAQINGVLRLQELKGEVRIIRDSHGVPHIYADNEHDLFFAVGFVHAQDRWAQMDLMRLSIEGRLSEIAGEDSLEEDFRNRLIGFKRLSEHAWHKLSPRSQAVLQSYSDGVNACLRTFRRTPPLEHRLLKLARGYEPGPWKPEDTVAVALYLDWNLAGNYDNEIQRWGLLQRIGEERAEQLAPHHRSPCPVILPEGAEEPFCIDALTEVKPDPLPQIIAPYNRLQRGVSLKELKRYLARDFSGGSLGLFSKMQRPVLASNSWVVSGKKTKSGNAILCNDPHLELLLPSVWVEMHLCGAGFDVTGVCFPGTPILSIGHNKHVAWGATTTCADNQDLFIETIAAEPQIGGSEEGHAFYQYGDQLESFKAMEEVFLVREGKRLKEVRRDVIYTRHGPVINPLIGWLGPDDPPISLKWTSYDPTDLVDGFLRVNSATSWETFLDGMKRAGGPVQNWVFADVEGNIAYIANGRIPVRAKGDGCMPLDGSEPESDWLGTIPQDLLPQILNPSKGFVATANNRVTEEDVGLPVSHYFDVGYRAERIVEVLDASGKIDRASMAQLQGDVLSARARRIAPLFVQAFHSHPVEEPCCIREAIKALEEWNYVMATNTPAPTIFEESVRFLPDLIFADHFPDGFHEKCRWLTSSQLDNIVADKEFPQWMDNLSTPEIESREEILVQALQQGCESLIEKFGPDPSAWLWGDVHVMKWKHFFFKDLPLPEGIQGFFTFGPFPRAGSRETVNNQSYSRGTLPYEVGSGPSMRMIVEMSDPPVGMITNTTGQAGQRMSRHFSDQMRDWLDLEYHEMLMDKEDILREAEGTLVLTPSS